MEIEYKTAFIESTFVKTSIWEVAKTVNGDDLARNMEAILIEMTLKGYELKTITPISSCSTTSGGAVVQGYTQGVLLIFQKV